MESYTLEQEQALNSWLDEQPPLSDEEAEMERQEQERRDAEEHMENLADLWAAIGELMKARDREDEDLPQYQHKVQRELHAAAVSGGFVKWSIDQYRKLQQNIAA
ncbi:MAG TPA: hypothetical protein V6D29_05650 [Leptolyngbyaceae cyanobacterium]